VGRLHAPVGKADGARQSAAGAKGISLCHKVAMLLPLSTAATGKNLSRQECLKRKKARKRATLTSVNHDQALASSHTTV